MMAEIKTVVTYAGCWDWPEVGTRITFWAAGNILYLNWGDMVIVGVYIHQKIINLYS